MKLYELNVKYYGLLNGARQLFEPDWNEFEDWIYSRRAVQLDFEGNVTPHLRERKIITIQFGSVNQPKSEQWAFQWSYLNDYQKNFMKMILESDRWEKLIQNALWELTVSLNYGIRIRNIYDTLLVERILWCGYSGTYQVSAELDQIILRRFGFAIITTNDIDEGMNFGDDIITSSKLRYLSRDVQFLDGIKRQQLLELHLHDLEFVAALENEAVIGFAQMMWEGMDLNKEEWLQNVEWAMPLIEEAEDKLNDWLKQEPFKSQAIKLKYINTQDQLLINWKSNTQKALIAQRLFPGCSGGSKAVVNKWMVDSIRSNQHAELYEVVFEFISGSKILVEEHLLKNHREWLIENDLFRPAGTSVINWNSVPQVLPLLKVVAPYLKNMNADSMGKFSHPIGLDIEHYKERKKLVDTYGEEFLNHIDPDGRVRTEFNQIVVTGRVSSKKPNMQQVPAKELTQTNDGKGQRYRNCFKPPKGFKFVSSDYVSQELVVIAFITKDKIWQEAIRKKQDLHSIAAELVFATDKNPFHISWKSAAQADCAYYKMQVGENGKLEPAHQKCKCPKHKVIREACKTINFMLAYGGTEYRLAALLRVPVKEARALIADYFKAFPAIGRTMTYLGRFGMKNGYIQTLAPFFRKRWFPEWQYKKQYLDEHLAGVRPDRSLSEIDKASKNQPIQGASADITKVAVCMVMWELDDAKLHNDIKLVLQVHDQLDTVARDEVADIWKPRLTEIMEEAAKVVIPTGLLKAETQITNVWSK